LQLLQEMAVAGARVLDVGTGSGVLAIAASRLGAAQVLAIDCDGDALTSARENVALNGEDVAIRLQHVELASPPPELSAASFDIVLANLTAAVLIRHAETLARRLAPAGVLIASGFGQGELTEVAGAFAVTSLAVTTRADEGEWVALTFGAASAAQATSR
jgi:ribosomal protein L11 methyltransferase